MSICRVLLIALFAYFNLGVLVVWDQGPTPTATPSATPTATPTALPAFMADPDIEGCWILSGADETSAERDVCGVTNGVANNAVWASGTWSSGTDPGGGSNATDFDGSMRFDIVSDARYGVTENTLGCWVRMEADQVSTIIDDDTNTIALRTYSAGYRPEYWFKSTVERTATDTMAQYTWAHVVGRHKADATGCTAEDIPWACCTGSETGCATKNEIFVNGVEDCNGPCSTKDDTLSQSINLLVGGRGSSGFLDGQLYECFHFSTAMTDREICSICRFGLSGLASDRSAQCNACEYAEPTPTATPTPTPTAGPPTSTPVSTATATPTNVPPTPTSTPTATPAADPNVLLALETFETGQTVCKHADHPNISHDVQNPDCAWTGMEESGGTYAAEIDDDGQNQIIQFKSIWNASNSVVCDMLFEIEADSDSGVNAIFFQMYSELGSAGSTLKVDGDGTEGDGKIWLRSDSNTADTSEEDITPMVGTTFQLRIAHGATEAACIALRAIDDSILDAGSNGDCNAIWYNAVGEDWDKTDGYHFDNADGTAPDPAGAITGFDWGSNGGGNLTYRHSFDNISCCALFPADPATRCDAP